MLKPHGSMLLRPIVIHHRNNEFYVCVCVHVTLTHAVSFIAFINIRHIYTSIHVAVVFIKSGLSSLSA